ncbi:MAG: hypothetical protein EP330_15330 [Deltaproteobacteria bacterium]|nr:MAG: hypothetical protein EP330_15330 [Deltaproteobacteria bacterium]
MSDDWKRRAAELGEATEPTEAEVQRVDARLDADVRQAMRIVTEPTEAEIARVGARLRDARAPRALPWASSLALTAAAAAMAGVGWSARFGPVDLPVGEVATIQAPVSVGLATVIEGQGSARVLQANRASTVVEVVDGELTFEVDPRAWYRSVSVRSGDVEVRVRGTRFSVSDARSVRVEHGHVEVFRGGRQVADLEDGQAWSPPAPPPVVVRKPPPPKMEPPGWRPHTRPKPPVQAVLSPVVSRPEPVPVVATAPRTPPPPKPSAAVAFQTVLSRAEAGRDAGILAADWSIFLGSYPDAPSALRTEARARRLEAWLETLPPEDAVARVAEFLAEEPTHPRRHELAYAQATLLRGDLRDCQSALEPYALAASGGGDLGARAHVFAAVCELHLGRPEAAADELGKARAIGVPEDVERYATRVERKLERPR